jgi:hypothetical protein
MSLTNVRELWSVAGACNRRVVLQDLVAGVPGGCPCKLDRCYTVAHVVNEKGQGQVAFSFL